MTSQDEMLKLLSNTEAAASAPKDYFTGIGAAYSTKKSLKLPEGRHECKITECKIHSGNSGVFFILEFELLKTSVEGLPLGPGYALLMDPTKPLRFGPWIKGLIRAVLKLDFSADSEKRLLAEGDAIARAAAEKGLLNGREFGVVQTAAQSKPSPGSPNGNAYLRQDWFPTA